MNIGYSIAFKPFQLFRAAACDSVYQVTSGDVTGLVMSSIKLKPNQLFSRSTFFHMEELVSFEIRSIVTKSVWNEVQESVESRVWSSVFFF